MLHKQYSNPLFLITHKGQKHLENKPLSAKNMTQPKKLALFQSVTNLKIKDSITKKRKSEQNLLKGIQTEKSQPYQSQNQPFLTQISSVQHNMVHMTEGNQQKQSNMEYFQAQRTEISDKGFFNLQECQQPLSHHVIDHPSYKRYNQLYNQFDQQQELITQVPELEQIQQYKMQINSNTQNENENNNKQIGNRQTVSVQSHNQSKTIQQERSPSNQKPIPNQTNGSNYKTNNNNYNNNNNANLLKNKQSEPTQQGKQFKKKKTNLQVQINSGPVVSEVSLNNQKFGLLQSSNEASLSPERSNGTSGDNNNTNRKDLQIILNEPEICNIFKKMQPDYTSMMEMLSHRNKEVHKLSNYKLNLSQKLLELRNQVHLLQNNQKRNSLQDVAQQNIKSFTNSAIVQIVQGAAEKGSNQIGQSYLSQIYNSQEEKQQQQLNNNYDNQNDGINTISNCQNTSDIDMIDFIPQNTDGVVDKYGDKNAQNTKNMQSIHSNHNYNNNVQNSKNGTMNRNVQSNRNGVNNKNEGLKQMQYLTNEEIMFPLSTKSQGVPTRDTINSNLIQKPHRLSNDFAINKENLLFSSKNNTNIINSDSKYNHLANSDQKKQNTITPATTQQQKVPKQAQVFKFNNIKIADTSQQNNLFINSQATDFMSEQQQQQSQEFTTLQEQQNEILRQIAAPLSCKSVRNDQFNTIPTQQRNYTSQNQNIYQKKQQIQTNQYINNNNNSNNNQQIAQMPSGEEDLFLLVSQGKKSTLPYKKSSKDFLLDKLQADNQQQQQRLQNKNYANVNTLISNSASIQPAGVSPIILSFPATTTSKSSYQSSKISNSSPIFYKSTNQVSRVSQPKKKNFQAGGTSARLKDQDSYRNKLHQQYNAKCSTTENSKVYRRLSTNDGNIQNQSSENIIINPNIKNGSSNCSQPQQDQNNSPQLQQLQQQQQQINSTLLSNGNSTYFPLNKKEAPQPFSNQQTKSNMNAKNGPSLFKNPNQYKILLSNAQSYTTSNNSTNGYTQHYSTNYQNLSSQAETTQPFLKNAQVNNFIQQTSNGQGVGETQLIKQILSNQNLNQLQQNNWLISQDQFILQNIPAYNNNIKSTSEECQQQQTYPNDSPLSIEIGLTQIKEKMKRVLNKYANKQLLLENFNMELLEKLDTLKI